ncbi:hypothetical protein [Bacillus haynesii]
MSVRGKIAGLPNIPAFCSACGRLFYSDDDFYCNRFHFLIIYKS